MSGLDIPQVLNTQFACAQCHANAQWVWTARPTTRQNSSIHRLQCAQCGAQIVAKASRGRAPDSDDCAEVREEYETLCALQPVFAGCARYGTLEPLGFLEVANHGVMITGLFPGEELDRHARKLNATGVYATFRSAGVWLRKLHGAGGGCHVRQGLEVGKRIDYLEATYGSAFAADRKLRSACELFARVGRDADTLAIDGVRIHGDFKPSNMLCNATRYVGLDIQRTTTGAAVYDLAPFVNHLWLANLGGIGARARRRHELAETAFLAGFGDAVDMRALRWAQLYFSLCYWGGYRQRGALDAVIARWKMLPLVEKTAAQLRALT
jgi:hypothetical protein